MNPMLPNYRASLSSIPERLNLHRAPGRNMSSDATASFFPTSLVGWRTCACGFFLATMNTLARGGGGRWQNPFDWLIWPLRELRANCKFPASIPLMSRPMAHFHHRRGIPFEDGPVLLVLRPLQSSQGGDHGAVSIYLLVLRLTDFQAILPSQSSQFSSH